MNFGIIILDRSMETTKLCYADTDSFVVHIITEDFLEIFLVMLKDGLIHLTMLKMIKELFQ